ncbi:hypothetical protein CC79DRAFT_1321905 [Sarocladium strictum]
MRPSLVTAAAAVLTTVSYTTLPTTSVTTTVTTSVTTVDESSAETTQTDWTEATSTIYSDTTTVVETEYAATKTVEAGSGIPVRDLELNARYAVPAPVKEYPTYASVCGSFEKPTETSICTKYSTTVSTEVVVEHSTEINYIPYTESVDATTYIATETVWEHTVTSTQTITPTVTSVVRNGGFESGTYQRWRADEYNQLDFSITRTGNRGTKYALQSGNMWNNYLLEIYQNTLAVEGVRYKCVYDWKFTNYYSTWYAGEGKYFIPYIHVYLRDSWDAVDWVSPTEDTKGTWQTSSFEFTAVGGDRIWFDAASPQPNKGAGSGQNKLYLDNIACYPIPV